MTCLLIMMGIDHPWSSSDLIQTRKSRAHPLHSLRQINSNQKLCISYQLF